MNQLSEIDKPVGLLNSTVFFHGGFTVYRPWVGTDAAVGIARTEVECVADRAVA